MSRLPLSQLATPIARLKPYLRWLILGLALFFLTQTLMGNWKEVMSIKLTGSTWAGLSVALGVTLLAHIWAGWVWHWILDELGVSIKGIWTTSVYLKTNIVKYLPGNVWHFYGRVRALKTAGASTDTAVVGVLLEPLLMVTAALTVAVLGNWYLGPFRGLAVLALVVALVGVHPRFLNPILKVLAQLKLKTVNKAEIKPVSLLRYPLKPYLGELGFVLLRGIGFLLAVMLLQPISGTQVLPILGGFSLAWLLGVIVPGAPGGIGVFEAVAIATLQSQLATGLLLSSVVFYRLISTLAEAIGAGLIWLDHPSRSTALPPSPKIRALLTGSPNPPHPIDNNPAPIEVNDLDQEPSEEIFNTDSVPDQSANNPAKENSAHGLTSQVTSQEVSVSQNSNSVKENQDNP